LLFLFLKFQQCWLLVEYVLQVCVCRDRVTLLIFVQFKHLIETKILNAGVLTDPLAPSSFGAWINYAGKNHIGAISFLIADFFLFFGVFALTAVQASQVCLTSLSVQKNFSFF